MRVLSPVIATLTFLTGKYRNQPFPVYPRTGNVPSIDARAAVAAEPGAPKGARRVIRRGIALAEILNEGIKSLQKASFIDRVRKRLLRYTGMEVGSRYLDAYGWQTSKRAMRPIDEHGSPIPWITYPALTVLRTIVQPHNRVFEYGCGNSSLWWAAHARNVISVEHNAEWAAKIASQAPSNLTVLLRPLQQQEPKQEIVESFLARKPDLPLCGSHALDIEHGLLSEGFSGYATEITKHEPFDIIVIDGMARSLCSWVAPQYLAPDGIIVFDNADRWQYNAGYLALAELGFGRVDFWGPGPVNSDPWCTSIFYRSTKWSMPLIVVDPKRKTGIDWVIEHATAQANAGT